MNIAKNSLDVIIGENVRCFRKLKGISMEELADVLGKSTSCIGLIERGNRGTTNINLLKLSELFQVPIDTFFKPQNSEFMLYETENSETMIKKAKINAYLSDCGVEELDIVLNLLKGMKKVRPSKTKKARNNDDSNNDDDDRDVKY